MKKYWSWIAKKKLNTKFTSVIGVLVFIPLSIIFIILFQNNRNNVVQQEFNNLKYKMNQNHQGRQSILDLSYMSTQVVLNHESLRSFLVSTHGETNINTKELIEFFNNDIKMLENLVNSNPYLHQIRVYSDNNYEMMPILYKKSRMNSFSWAKNYESGKWQFDYEDSVLKKSVNSLDHAMALVTSITDYRKGEVGVIEVAIDMEKIFPEVFNADENEFAVFIDEYGNIYHDKESISTGKWLEYKKEVFENIEIPVQEEYGTAKIAGNNVIIGKIPVKELSGYVVHIADMEDELYNLRNQRNKILTIILIIYIVLIILINRIVKALLKRFYSILDIIREIQKGNIEIRYEDVGFDEMGELGDNINLMLDKIDELMHENLSRELLMKNSEIRALQNQINAHFIYNVLESIKMMAEIEEEYLISDSITSLGKLLRYGMKWGTGNVTIGQEIDYVKNYLDLINLRFDYKINLALKIPPNIYNQLIPKMSLQPIVENAIYHGIEEVAEDSSIYLKAIIDDNNEKFQIEITDSGAGMTEKQLKILENKLYSDIDSGGGSGNGIGLKNVQDRIQITFGKDYGISIHSETERYTKVVIKLPITYKGV